MPEDVKISANAGHQWAKSLSTPDAGATSLLMVICISCIAWGAPTFTETTHFGVSCLVWGKYLALVAPFQPSLTVHFGLVSGMAAAWAAAVMDSSMRDMVPAALESSA